MTVVLAVPDAGPLISLGRANRLGVLLTLGLPVYVVDQVRYEITKDTRFVDAARIHQVITETPIWFMSSAPRSVKRQQLAAPQGKPASLDRAKPQ